MNKKSTNIFSSKADVLKYLKNNVKKSYVENMSYFTTNDWLSDKNSIIQNIKEHFKESKKIIIRSSALGEDSIENSMAGQYDSVLNISPKSKSAIESGIKQVIKSYKKNHNLNKKNQILIQNQTENIKTSGVIFSKTPDVGDPYYIINFEDGGTTTKTTHGLSNNLIKIHRNVATSKLEKRWKVLLFAIKEIEKLCNSDELDIEFGITNSFNIIIFQVRPLTSIKQKLEKNTTKKISNQIKKNQIKLKKIINSRNISKSFIFSDMTDWNPAEIIGSNPNNLSYSLYSYLITDDVWKKSRIYLDYYDVGKTKLMIRFGNKPYIDVNASFNSLIPKNFSSKLRKKLIDFYIQKLKNNPYLHDKAEFKIIFSCYDFTIDDRLNELKKSGFTQNEVNQIKENLRLFTKKLILNGEKSIYDCENQLEKMIMSRNKILKTLRSKNVNQKNKLILLKTLLNDCKDFGTISFAIMARLSFVGSILLKSLQDSSRYSFNYDNFLNTIATPLTEIQNDLIDYKNNKISKNNFLKKYGHLRPGTYDITTLPYSKNETFLSEINFSKKITHKKIKSTNKKISKEILNELTLPPTFNLLELVSNLIIQREKFKFEFTKNLSLILELISTIGKNLKLSRKELAYLDISTILNSTNKSKSEIRKEWNKKINSKKNTFLINNHLSLPQIISSKNDFDIITYHLSQPNYITQKIIKSSLLELTADTKFSSIKNSILLIENADPGYDWIFSKNPAGLITKYGGVASHMSIRCAEIGLPAAIGTGEVLFEKLKTSTKIQLDCKNQQIFVLENKKLDNYIEERKLLKSLGYIK